MEASKNIIKRANETIGIVPSGNHRLTNLVRRLYSAILLFSQRQGDQEEYRAVLADMLKATNSPGSNRTQVKAILRDIRSIGVDWNVREGDRDVWKNVGLIEEPGLIDGKGTPTIVTWKLPKIIRNRLLDPRGFFTRISLEIMTHLKSGASIALYEICCQYASNDHGKGDGGLTFRASLDDWMPRILGTRKSGYEYKFFKRDVLLPAIEEIHEIADLRVELIEHKAGRKVTELQFRVFRKDVVFSPVSGSNPARIGFESLAMLPTVERIMALGASKSLAERIYKKYIGDEAYLIRQVEYVESRIRNQNATPLQSKMAFLQRALDQGFAEKNEVSQQAQIAPRVVIPIETDEEKRERQAKLQAREDVWTRYQAISNEETKKSLLDQFLKQANSMIVTFFKKNGLNNMVVRVNFSEWLMDVKNF